MSGARIHFSLPITNESTGSNSAALLTNELQASAYLNACRTSNQTSASIQTFGNGIIAATPFEAAMIATIQRLREQNIAQLTSLIRSGLLSSTVIGSGKNDFSTCTSGVANNISDCISRVNASVAPPLLSNISMACLNGNSGGFNVTPTMR